MRKFQQEVMRKFDWLKEVMKKLFDKKKLWENFVQQEIMRKLVWPKKNG